MLKAMQWELYWGVLSAEHQKWAQVSYFCLTHVRLSQLHSSAEQTHLQFEVTGSVRDFLDLVFALVTTEGKKHGQALPGILQGKPKPKVIFRSDFLKCLLKKLSLSALHKNEPGNQILIKIKPEAHSINILFLSWLI